MNAEIRWCGEPLGDMSREQLIEVIRYQLGQQKADAEQSRRQREMYGRIVKEALR